MNEKMRKLGSHRSVIRELFEYGRKRKAEIGEENVFDFSLGNPSVPSPDLVNRELIRLLSEEEPTHLHGYTTAAGDLSVRQSIASYIEKTHGLKAREELLYLTVGAAAALTVTLSAIVNPGDEVIVIAPYFPEYRVFIEQAGARVVPVLSDRADFGPDIDAIKEKLTERCAAIIINYPNNPTGAVISEEKMRALAALLSEKAREFSHPIYLISDEPYRELVYTDRPVPYPPSYYDDTVVCDSFSKSLSLPGERIGYVMVSPRAREAEVLYDAIAGAGRALGYVCAPSLFQRLLPALLGTHTELSVYRKNRDLLYGELIRLGFSCVYPEGAFYLFVKSPLDDAEEFSRMAREYELLLVPSDSFGMGGYVRISYCVATETIERSLPAFAKLKAACDNVNTKA